MQGFNNLPAGCLPEGSKTIVEEWLKPFNCTIRLSKARTSKSGDFRPANRLVPYHRISVNANLNPYAFLWTLTHEIAHMRVWEAYKSRVRPHAGEWQNEFKRLLSGLTGKNIFPETVENEIVHIIHKRVHASGAAEHRLIEFLSDFDKNTGKMMVKHLPDDALFMIHNGTVFKKGRLMRKNYKCLCVQNNKWYYVSPVLFVKKVNNV
jgi:hypothetical protein